MKPVSYANTRAEIESVQPLGDYVLVRRLPDLDVSSFLVKPAKKEGQHLEPPRHGEVLRVGPGDRVTKGPHKEQRHPMHVAPGDRVIYWRAPANNIVVEGEEYTFLHEQQHILAVIE